MATRRDFLKLAGTTTISLISSQLFEKIYAGDKAFADTVNSQFKIPAIKPTDADNVVLAEGLSYDLLFKWGDTIGATKETYGNTNDFLAIQEIANKKNEFYLWVNHEYPLPYLTHGKTNKDKKTKDEVILEQKSVGGSLLHIKKNRNSWEFVKNSPVNKRFDAQTEIPFAQNQSIAGSKTAIGTHSNCAGGKTSWGTFLTCEENYGDFYGSKQIFGWIEYFNYPEEHYGWVVEINPSTQKAQKLTSLGRFEHEGATTTIAPDGRTVVYMGDDAADEHIYKFISAEKNSLEKGTLYVANTEKGIWEELSIENPKLKKEFKTQLDLLINTRKAAKILGATPHDRPEDIELLKDNTVLVACTNNPNKIAPHGYIFAIEEENKNPLSLKFKSYKWLECGENAGISCPDNLALDKNGNLWVTSDVNEKLMGKAPYAERKNNGLFYIPTHGPLKGVVHQIASAPTDAEFAGPCFSPDYKTLLICVQHPGARSNSKEFTSQWPKKGDKPRSAVITISGKLLNQLQS